ncbi:amino acid/amide ABC transporter membrane protein 2, HAAT family [Limimonas halophila]|uniref:Amino acid/amide ABC transporter membrane protein 2, HAAT family n=1 Tax=Limimonas halophila TaxID=1082479 RepID=A0A1G7PXH6_9PROT|nr:branched-chain amino acid ABC transporter permease [Limimonas halophila]SDF90329.1 amino acid/amide ABC transporter membrane protein 2, HAAT family [Limimonas halophila]
MTEAAFVKGILLAIPIFVLALWLVPGRWYARVPGAAVAGIALGLLIASLMGAGNLSYVVSFLSMASIYAVLTLGLNVQWGYTGHLNFGIAGFFAVGAFTTALVTTSAPTGTLAQYSQQAFGLEMPFLVGVVAAGGVAGIVALIIAPPVLRLRMDFLAIATIGIAEIIRRIFQNERWLANGPQPLRGIPQPLKCAVGEGGCAWMPEFLVAFLGPLEPRHYSFIYLIVLVIFLALVYLVLEAATRSPWGRVLRSIRDEEASAGMNGKAVTNYRVQAFVAGAVIMGVAGALYAHYMVTIDYTHFRHLFATFLIWVMLMLGGSGNNKGALLGAFVIWGVWAGTAFIAAGLEPVLAEVSQPLAERSSYIRWMLVAILLAVVVLFRPQGIIKENKIVSRYLLGTNGTGDSPKRATADHREADFRAG